MDINMHKIEAVLLPDGWHEVDFDEDGSSTFTEDLRFIKAGRYGPSFQHELAAQDHFVCWLEQGKRVVAYGVIAIRIR